MFLSFNSNPNKQESIMIISLSELYFFIVTMLFLTFYSQVPNLSPYTKQTTKKYPNATWALSPSGGNVNTYTPRDFGEIFCHCLDLVCNPLGSRLQSQQDGTVQGKIHPQTPCFPASPSEEYVESLKLFLLADSWITLK